MPSQARSIDLSGEIAALLARGPEQRKQRWRVLYGTEPPTRISEDLLRRAIAFRLQERALGGLKPSTRRLLRRLAEDARRSRSAPLVRKIRPGAVLLRQWRGRSHQVTVLEDDVLHRGSDTAHSQRSRGRSPAVAARRRAEAWPACEQTRTGSPGPDYRVSPRTSFASTPIIGSRAQPATGAAEATATPVSINGPAAPTTNAFYPTTGLYSQPHEPPKQVCSILTHAS